MSIRSSRLCLSLLLPTACFAPYATPLAEEGSSSGLEGSSTGSDTGDSTSSESSTSLEEEAVCGNGELEVGEACDDGLNDGSYGSCIPGCTELAGHCGDGIVQDSMEACDDGDDVQGNGCNSDCNTSGALLWSSYFDASESLDHDNGIGLTLADDDSIFVASWTHPNNKAHLRRLTSAGSTIWSKTFAHPDALPRALAGTNDGHVAIVGGIDDPPEAWISMVAPDGKTVWSETIADLPALYGITFMDDGSVLAAGSLSNHTRFRRYDTNGNVLWTDSAPYEAFPLSVDAFPMGGSIIAGNTNLAGNGLWLRRFSESNLELWTRILPAYEGATHLSVAKDGRLFVCGTDWSTGGWIAALSSDGTIEWSVTQPPADPTGWIDLLAIAATPEGGAFVVGHFSAPSEDITSDILVQRLSPDGEQQWEQTISSPFIATGFDYQQAQAVEVDSAGNAVVAGYIQTDDGADTWIAKFAP